MAHRAAKSFWVGYHTLPADVRKRANKQFALLKADQHHPSLRFKKIRVRRTREVWSVRVTDGYRALAVRHSDAFVWFWIGEHAVYDILI